MLLRQLSTSHERTVGEAAAGVRAVLDEVQENVSRDAALVAGEVVLVRGDEDPTQWYQLGGLASQRIVAFMAGRGAQFLAVVDPSGRPAIVLLGQPLPAVASPERPTGMLTLIGGEAYVLGAARFAGREPLAVLGMLVAGRAVAGAFGVAMIGRRIGSLAPRLAPLPSRPALVALAADRVAGSTRADLPASGWAAATRAGEITLAGEPWSLRLLRGFDGGALWLLLPEGRYRTERARLRSWLLVSFGVATGLLLGAAWLASRRGRSVP